MASERLLKRMANWQQDKKHTGNEDLTDQILADVERLLNIQRGNVLIDADMGMPDIRTVFHSHMSPDLDDLSSQILHQITQFEPRLAKVEVSNDESERQSQDGLLWNLKAEHINAPGDWFEADVKVDVSGSITVRAKK